MPERLVEIENDIYIGSFSLVKKSRVIEKTPTVSVAQTTVGNTDYHHPLTDGKDNGKDFIDAVERVRTLFRAGDGVVVYCAAGKSRSVAVLATALAAEKQTSFRTMISVIQGVRPKADPVRELREQGQRYLQEQA